MLSQDLAITLKTQQALADKKYITTMISNGVPEKTILQHFAKLSTGSLQMLSSRATVHNNPELLTMQIITQIAGLEVENLNKHAMVSQQLSERAQWLCEHYSFCSYDEMIAVLAYINNMELSQDCFRGLYKLVLTAENNFSLEDFCHWQRPRLIYNDKEKVMLHPDVVEKLPSILGIDETKMMARYTSYADITPSMQSLSTFCCTAVKHSWSVEWRNVFKLPNGNVLWLLDICGGRFLICLRKTPDGNYCILLEKDFVRLSDAKVCQKDKPDEKAVRSVSFSKEFEQKKQAHHFKWNRDTKEKELQMLNYLLIFQRDMVDFFPYYRCDSESGTISLDCQFILITHGLYPRCAWTNKVNGKFVVDKLFNLERGKWDKIIPNIFKVASSAMLKYNW